MFDFVAIGTALKAHGRLVRLVVAETQGSCPREAGTAMLIWESGHEGTIGGGQLEFGAIEAAREMLQHGPDSRVRRIALGPGTGACCGGEVTLVHERITPKLLGMAARRVGRGDSYARRLGAGPLTMPDALRHHLDRASKAGGPVPIRLVDGWLAEPVWQERLPVHIYGAGHVGRALATVLAPLAQFEVHLSDVREEQFDDLPATIRQSWDLLPTDIMAAARDDAAHFIMTPEPEYDLELCHRLLGRSFGYAGLIGSGAKWTWFRSRLAALGHSATQIARIQCPMGDPALGKHPQAIAIGVASRLLAHQQCHARRQRSTA